MEVSPRLNLIIFAEGDNQAETIKTNWDNLG